MEDNNDYLRRAMGMPSSGEGELDGELNGESKELRVGESQVHRGEKKIGRRGLLKVIGGVVLVGGGVGGGIAVLNSIFERENRNRISPYISGDAYQRVNLKEILLNPSEYEGNLLKIEESLNCVIYQYNKGGESKHKWGLGDTRMMPYTLEVVLDESEIEFGTKIDGRYIQTSIHCNFGFYDRKELFEEVYEKLRVLEKKNSEEDVKSRIVVYGFFNGKAIAPAHIIGFDDGTDYKEYTLSNIEPGYYGSTDDLLLQNR